MFWIGDEFADHGLNDAYIAIESAAQEAAKQSHPKIGGKANDKKGGNGTEAAHQQHRLAAYPIRQCSPKPG